MGNKCIDAQPDIHDVILRVVRRNLPLNALPIKAI
jgi:hypothetical protein